MSNLVQYTRTKATIVRELDPHHKQLVFLCDLEVHNEHDIALPTLRCVVVSNGTEAQIEKYPENILGDDFSDEQYETLHILCGDPQYSISNPKQLAAMLNI